MNLSYSSSSLMSSSSSPWSNLPLELLIKIKDELNRNDRISFRFACSHWRSAMPIPTTLPQYEVSYNDKSNFIKFTKDNINTWPNIISMSLFSNTSFKYLFTCSNGWLVFLEHKTKILSLIDPVLTHILVFPRMSLELFPHCKMLEPSVLDRCALSVAQAVVTSSTANGIAVVAIVRLLDGERIIGRRLVFCRYGYDQSWSVEGIEGIVDIIVARDGRILALNEDCELYILNEWPPMIILKRFRPILPKHVTDEGELFIQWYSMKESERPYLEIYGYSLRRRTCASCITLKLDMRKFTESSSIVNVVCEADEWNYTWNHTSHRCRYFTPVLTPSIKLKSKLTCV